MPVQAGSAARALLLGFFFHNLFIAHGQALGSSGKDGAEVLPGFASAPGERWLRTRGYVTEPHFKRQKFQVTYSNGGRKHAAPGYVFIAMVTSEGHSLGPQIYSADGEPVWFGPMGHNRVRDFKVCDAQSDDGHSREDHLCWTEEVETSHRTRATHIFTASRNYTIWKDMPAKKGVHEVRISDNFESFFTLDPPSSEEDLSPRLAKKNSWVKYGCIADYSTAENRERFRWCYSDHFSLFEATKYPHVNGQSKDTSAGDANSWAIVHGNSLDKNSEGDYIVSYGRIDQVIKIAGPDSASGQEAGSVLWRLGGSQSKFERHDKCRFSTPGYVRYAETNESGDVIALFDNACEGSDEPRTSHSVGKIIRVNNKTVKAELVQDFVHPEEAFSNSNGSIQILPNGNAFIGWGQLPEVTEFAKDGSPIYHAQFSDKGGGQFSYRAFKLPWIGKPLYPPKLLAYTSACFWRRKPLHLFISWNGDTEVKKWRVSTSSAKEGPWLPRGSFARRGFETQIVLQDPALYVRVVAIDGNEKALGTVSRKTFVPSSSLGYQCDEVGCPVHFMYDEYNNRAGQCNDHQTLSSISILALAAALLTIEIATSSVQSTISNLYYAKIATDEDTPNPTAKDAKDEEKSQTQGK